MNKTPEELQRENEELRLRLEEAEETLRAIGNGEVDAFVVSGGGGEQIFTLKDAEHPYRVLVETMNEGAATLAVDGTILYCNNRLAALLQVPLEKVIGTRFDSYVVPTDKLLITARLNRCGTECDKDETSLITSNGNLIPVLVSCCHSNWINDSGISVVVTDLSQQKRNEEFIASEKLAHSIIEQAGEVIIVCDQAGRVINASRLAHQLCGGNPLLKPFDESFPLHKANTGEPITIFEMFAGVTFRNVEITLNQGGRQTFHLILNSTLLHGAESVILGCVITLTDITERKRAEKALRIESLSRMAGAIAHHMNNQLQGVMFSLELLDDSKKISDSAETKRIVNSAIKSTEKASEISNLLLTYLAKVPVTFEIIDIADICRKTLGIWQAGKPANVDLHVQLPNDGPIVNSDASQLQQLMTNLVLNALEACEDRQGAVTLTVSTCEPEDIPSVCSYPIDFQLTSLKYACIEVTDTGSGIPEEFIDNLFDPFYSTKFTGRGMGLPVVLGIVRAHQGVIAVESRIGHGSVFRVYLPLLEEVQPKEEAPTQPSKQPLEHDTILVVEDDSIIRSVVASMLESIGFTVLQAEDGVEALELFEQRSESLVCVISDIVMPGMNGWEMLEALRRRSPGFPVIFTSGYAEGQMLEESHNEMPNIYLEKPFKFAMLEAALSNILTP